MLVIPVVGLGMQYMSSMVWLDTILPFPGRKVWLLASSGEENIPSLGDEVLAGSHAAQIVSSFHSTSKLLKIYCMARWRCVAGDGSAPHANCTQTFIETIAIIW